MIGDRIDVNLEIKAGDIACGSLDQRGWLAKVHQLFGAALTKVIDALNRDLAA